MSEDDAIKERLIKVETIQVDMHGVLQEIRGDMKKIADSTVTNSNTFREAINSFKVTSIGSLNELDKKLTAEIYKIKSRLAYYYGGIAVILYIVNKLLDKGL